MGKRNQERRRAKKKERDARQRARAATGQRFTSDFDDPFGAYPVQDGPDRVRPPRRRPLTEIVQTALAAVAQAPDEIVASVIEDAAAVLAAEQARDPAAPEALSAILLGLAERCVRNCWEGGWQPADLARLAGRQLAARHVRLAVDVIAAEARRHAAAAMDVRWSAQLRELDASVWWDDDRRYLAAWAARHGLEPLAAVTCALELLRLLTTLPMIPSVGPPPGGHSGADRRPPRRSSQGLGDTESRMLDRIRALLAKAESTEYEEEAEALTAKAQELMARHSISAALLAAQAGITDEPAARRIGVDNPYEGPKALLLDAVAEANRCRAVWSRAFGFTTVVGYAPDLDAVELLYTSLLVQATAAMTRAGSRRDRYGRSRTRAFRQSFLVAYAQRIGERLATATDQATQEAAGLSPDGTGMTSDVSDPRLLPVLAARTDAVHAATDRMFPGLTSRALTGSDREGWAYGTAAADRAVLHGHAEVRGPEPPGRG